MPRRTHRGRASISRRPRVGWPEFVFVLAFARLAVPLQFQPKRFVGLVRQVPILAKKRNSWEYDYCCATDAHASQLSTESAVAGKLSLAAANADSTESNVTPLEAALARAETSLQAPLPPIPGMAMNCCCVAELTSRPTSTPVMLRMPWPVTSMSEPVSRGIL